MGLQCSLAGTIYIIAVDFISKAFGTTKEFDISGLQFITGEMYCGIILLRVVINKVPFALVCQQLIFANSYNLPTFATYFKSNRNGYF